MDIVVTGRHVQISDRFREYAVAKLEKVSQYETRMQRVDVVVTHLAHRGTKETQRVEVTCRAKGPTIRAEAQHEDRFAALDLALDKLFERLRRVSDRKRVHRGRRTPESVSQATADLTVADAADAGALATEAPDDGPDLGDSPVEIREKTHSSAPMTLDQALYEMELVGHDFYLFHDVETDRPSVVYRRRGWSYGVIHLETTEPVAATGDEAAALTG